MLNGMSLRILKQLVSKCSTNPFPVLRMPDDLGAVLEAVKEGEAKLNSPVEPRGRFRGRVNYDRETCIGCGMCIKVCPANAIERSTENPKKIMIHNDRCCFCAQCNDICPVNALSMSKEFAIASYDREANVTLDTGSRREEPFQKVNMEAEFPGMKSAPADEGRFLAGEVTAKVKTVYEIDSEKCVGCTLCAKNCPVGAIEGKVKEAHRIDPEKCIACGVCAEKCPKNAIKAVDIEVKAEK